MRNINNATDFQCPTCRGQKEIEEHRDDQQLKGGVFEEVIEFCYLGDLLDSEGGMERPVRMRVSATWYKRKDISSLLINKRVPLKKIEPQSTMRLLDLCRCMALKSGQ